MPTLKHKLQSQRGASLVLALVAMALCLTVGASILMSASAAADALKTRKTGEKAALAVSSAAEILQGQMTGMAVSGTEVSSLAKAMSCVSAAHPAMNTTTFAPKENFAVTATLQKKLKELAISAMNGETQTDTLTLEADGVETVYAKIEISPLTGSNPDTDPEHPWTLTAKLIVWSGAAANPDYKITMSYLGTVTLTGDDYPTSNTVPCDCGGSTTTTTGTYQLSWTMQSLSNAGG